MTAATRFALVPACLALTLMVGACSSGTPLTTGTLLGGGPSQPETQAPESPSDRALHVAATSARAQRCGYVFDPAATRQDYLAYEAQQGIPAEQLARLQQSYDYTVTSMARKIASESDYCSDDRTVGIKRDLGQVLAGNFSSPPKATISLWSTPRAVAPMDREELFNPRKK